MRVVLGIVTLLAVCLVVVLSHQLAPVAPEAAQCALPSLEIGELDTDLLARCGPPKRVSATEGEGYLYEQWVYGGPHDLYVYVRNRRVTSWSWRRSP